MKIYILLMLLLSSAYIKSIYNFTKEEKEAQQISPSESTAIVTYDRQLIDAASVGNLDKVQDALFRGADINAAPNNKITALHAAAGHGYKEIVEFLLANGANVNAEDHEGNTPLVWAQSAEKHDVVKILEEHKAKLEKS